MVDGQQVKFETVGAAEDPLGLWAAAPGSGVHFGFEDGSGSPPEDVSIYRIQLPEDSAAADADFRGHETQLELYDQVLQAIPGRFENLVKRNMGQPQTGRNGSIHYGMDISGKSGDEFDTELLELLVHADTGGSFTPAAGEQVEFGVVDEVLQPAIAQAETQFHALLDQVRREVQNFAWVETTVQRQTVARTSIKWSGDAETVWLGGISPEQTALHNRALQFTTRSRAVKLRMLMTITGGVAKMAAIMTNPVLALPVLYQYVSRILAQTREFHALKQDIPNL